MIQKVHFDLLSPERVRQLSVLEVTNPLLYEQRMPCSGGLNDTRMGTIDRKYMCSTCGRNTQRCQGHPGHIELAFPCFHVGALEYIVKIVRCLCLACNRLVVHEDELEGIVSMLVGKARFQAVHAICRGRKRCHHCQLMRPHVFRQMHGLKLSWPPETTWASEEEELYLKAMDLRADHVLRLLQNIEPEDRERLGFLEGRTQPEHLVLTVLQVPPPCIRPCISISEGSRTRGQDDLTTRLQEILKRNADVRSLMTSLEDRPWQQLGVELTAEQVEAVQRLQEEVGSFMVQSRRTQQAAGSTHQGGQGGGSIRSRRSSARHSKSIACRLKGKEGRIRGSLTGKRVDFSARSVITPDPTIRVNDVGVPACIAANLTVPERVDSTNIERLSRCVERGPGVLGGAEKISTGDGNQKIHIAYCKDRQKLHLQYGWVVERSLTDGDVVLFNRQPTLHRMGMMGHVVRVMDGTTFRINPNVAKPYNADFDGDEMNLHVVQSPRALAEVRNLMMVQQQTISPQSNKPVLAIVQDSLLGAFLLTDPHTLLDRHHMCQCLRYSPRPLPPPAVSHPRQLWTGKQLVSLLMPHQLMFALGGGPRAAARAGDGSSCTTVAMLQGRLLAGRFSKRVLGASSGGLVDVVHRDFGTEAVLELMHSLQQVVNQWLLYRGFSVGIGDCTLDQECYAQVSSMCARVDHLAATLEGSVAGYHPEQAELTSVRMLSTLLLSCGSLVEQNMGHRNALRNMVQAGSKGTQINLAQICACIGQQSIEGQRILSGNLGTAVLPCYRAGETSARARGCVYRSYCQGQQADEFMFHQRSGREGLVDTAVKTSITGYIQRRLVKAEEDIMVHHDGTVRDAQGNIIQLLYGGDGLNPCALEKRCLPPACRQHCGLNDDPSCQAFVRQWLILEAMELDLQAHHRCCLLNEAPQDVLVPVDPARVFLSLQLAPRICKDLEQPVEPEQAEHLLEAALSEWKHTFGGPTTWAVRALTRHTFTPAAVQRHRLSHDKLVAGLHCIRDRIIRAIVDPGEAVGMLAAQSVGEPSTQLTLNTFHFCGVSTKNVTLGIPRLKEIIDFSQKIKTPAMLVALADGIDPQAAASRMPLLRVWDVVIHIRQFTGWPDAWEDQLLWDMEWHLGGHQEPWPSDITGVHATLNKSLMLEKQISLQMIRHTLAQHLPPNACLVLSEHNNIHWQLWCIGDSSNTLCNLAKVTRLQGVPGIASATVTERARPGMQNEVVIDTEGSCLLEIARQPWCDALHTTTNDIAEVYQVLGIEAAATVIRHELKQTLSFDGMYIDPRHIEVITDTMTARGYPMPFSRHGINRIDTGTLVRSSFEETFDVFMDAAIFGETDSNLGVTSRIITGQPAFLGTRMVQLKKLADCGTGHKRPASSTAEDHVPDGNVVRSKIRRRGSMRNVQETCFHKEIIGQNNCQIWIGQACEPLQAPFVSDHDQQMSQQEQEAHSPPNINGKATGAWPTANCSYAPINIGSNPLPCSTATTLFQPASPS